MGRDRSRTVTAEAIHAARERIILRRETHLDQLTDKLQEERVKRVIAPLLSGSDAAETIRLDDLQAFLQRIVNSGGRVEREYGLGRMRADLLIVWPADVPPGADAADDDRVQGAPRQPGAHHSRGDGAYASLHGPLRGRRRPSGDIRSHAREGVAGEVVPAPGAGERSADHGVGHVAGMMRASGSICPPDERYSSA